MLGKGHELIIKGRILLLRLLPSLFLLIVFSQQGASQELPQWRMDSVRLEVKRLLVQFQFIHNQLTAHANQDLERDFINLFSNPKVLIVNDIEERPSEAAVSAQDYLTRLPELFPDGLNLTFHTDRMLVSRPRYDFNNRYLVKVWIDKSLMGISGGKVLSMRQRVILTIGFFLTEGQITDLEIRGMALPAKGQSYFKADLSPVLTTLGNRTIGQDGRFSLRPGFSYQAGAQFMQLLNTHWGILLGARYSLYHSALILDRMDPLDGFDPHLEQVSFDTRLWFAEMSGGLAYRLSLSRRLHGMIGIGLVPGIRLFESSVTSAINSNGRGTLSGVVSDAAWVDGLKRFTLAFRTEASLAWYLRQNVALTAGIGFEQGLTRLGHVEQPDFSQSRYQGQYNPMWRTPESGTFSRSFGLTFGTLIRIEQKREE